jgi:glycosyltransferase involved in cell wall biosynthesis
MAGDLPTVVVVGPFAVTAGGVVTFQKNLTERSNLKERWRLVPHSNSRPPKVDVANNYAYAALWNSGLRRFVKGAAVTALNLGRFPIVLKRQGPRCVQIQASDHLAFWESMAYGWLAHRAGVPVSMRFGGAFDNFYGHAGRLEKRLIRRALRGPDQIVVQSEGWKSFFSELTDAERLNVVPNAVPPPPPPPERGEHTTEVEALFIATADAQRKGVETVLAAAPSLRGRVRFTFVAAGAPVRERVAELGLQDVVTCHGVVSRDEMVAFYRRADVFLIPSYGEGFPNSMLEAMSHALPVVGAPAGAIPEVIEQGVGGFLNPADDAIGLARDVRTLADDPALRHAMGAHNHALVSEVYALDAVFARFDSIWERAAAARR